MNLWLIFVILFIHIHFGYFNTKRKQTTLTIFIGWANVMMSLALMHVAYLECAPLIRMLVLIVSTLVALKNVVTSNYYPDGSPLSYLQWLCFTLGWFGMRPGLFESLRFSNPDFKKRKDLLLKGISRIVAGSIMIALTSYFVSSELYYLRVLLILIGLSLVLHFGILNVQAWWWNSWGADCRELFKAPLKSKSLNEFWGKRWNMAFSEMTSLAVYRPVKKTFGTTSGIIAAFIFSGLLHEMAISLPVMNGFGLPLLYFVIHGILMQMEERVGWLKRILPNPVAAHGWVLFWLITPMPLLFHKYFMNEILNFKF